MNPFNHRHVKQSNSAGDHPATLPLHDQRRRSVVKLSGKPGLHGVMELLPEKLRAKHGLVGQSLRQKPAFLIGKLAISMVDLWISMVDFQLPSDR